MIAGLKLPRTCIFIIPTAQPAQPAPSLQNTKVLVHITHGEREGDLSKASKLQDLETSEEEAITGTCHASVAAAQLRTSFSHV